MGQFPPSPPEPLSPGESAPQAQASQPPATTETPPPAPPQQAYEPPQQGGGQPYQPPGQQQAGQPPTPPPVYPSQQKKGFNWLACCGISCGVLLLIGVIVFFLAFRSCQNVIEMFQPMIEAGQKVKETDIATIIANATPVSSAEVAANPDAYVDQWLAVEGEIIAGAAFGGQTFSAGDFSTEETTNYTLEGGLEVMDASGAPPVGSSGDTIRAYGMVVIVDMSKMPIIGDFMEEAMEDEGVPGGKFILFMAKEVELASEATDSAGGDAGDGSESDESSDSSEDDDSAWAD